MKAITLSQPWAQLVVLGAKRVETRTWPTPYRGWLAIHSGRHRLPEGDALCAMEPCRGVLKAAGLGADTLPLGQVIGLVRLVNCVRIGPNTTLPGQPERAFGNYAPGRYMWLLMDPKPSPRPSRPGARAKSSGSGTRLPTSWSSSAGASRTNTVQITATPCLKEHVG